MKSFTRFHFGFLLLALCAISCNNRPDCTIREVSPGVFEPWGNCNGCSQITVIGYNGVNRDMNLNQVSNYVHSYPPAAYNGHNSGLSDLLLYHVLFNSPRANQYQSIYAPRYNTYVNYNRYHPSTATSTQRTSTWSSRFFSNKNKNYRPSAGFSRTNTGSAYKPSSGFSRRNTSPSYSSSSGFSRSSSASSSRSSYSSGSGFRSSGGYRSSGGFSRGGRR